MVIVRDIANRFFTNKYGRVIVLGSAVALLGLGSLVVYRWYDVYRQRGDQQVLAVSLRELRDAEHSPEADALGQAQASLDHAYAYSSKSSTALYLLALKAQVFIQQGKLSEAREALDQLLAKISSSNPLYYAYKLERALISIDLGDVSAIAELQHLAQDKHNVYRDKALYYVGSYYWAKDDVESAKTAWNSLIELDAAAAEHATSPWASLAREKMAYNS